MPEHPRKRETRLRELTGAVILPAVEMRVGLDRVAAHDIERDGLSRDPRRPGNDDRGFDLIGVARGPAEGLVGAKRATDDGAKAFDAEQVDEALLHVDHIFDGHQGEVAAVGNPGGGIDRRGPGGSPAATEHVGTDDEKSVGVEGLARADEPFPPTRFVALVVSSGMRVARNRMAD